MRKARLPVIPTAIGVIMDGNRRFAKKNNYSVAEGHRAGFETLKKCVRWAQELGVKTLYAYAFSTENWRRSPKEIFDLMKLLRFALVDKEVRDSGARIIAIGNRARFNKAIREGIAKLERETMNNKKGTVVLALSYGGREEILEATRSLLRKKILPGNLSEKVFSDELYTRGLPDPNLIIRTGTENEEVRLSNFLPWQSVYSELFGTRTLWPEFTKRELLSIVKKYEKCSRKNGK